MQTKIFHQKISEPQQVSQTEYQILKALKQGKNLEYGSYFKQHSSNATLMHFSII